MQRSDVIIIGLGAVGSAAAYHLARSGKRVTGFDRFAPPHRFGSTHGESRITRLAIGEGAEYSPLAIRSHAIWRDLEAQTGQTLFVQCGGLIISNEKETRENHGVRDFLGRTFAAARKYNIPHERLPAPAIRERFPQFNVQDHELAYYEPSAGYLHVERCVEAQLTLARDRHQAELHLDTVIKSFRRAGAGVEVVTQDGDVYTADQVLVTAGAWLPGLLGPPYQDHFLVTRQVMHWFEIRTHTERFSKPDCPIFIWEPPGKPQPIYGFPPANNDPGAGLKLATEGHERVDPDHVVREEPEHLRQDVFREYFSPSFPDLGPRSLRAEVCLYTEVAGGRFVVDRLPDLDKVLFASACSGHGFKHSTALGEAFAQLLSTGTSQIDLSPFRLSALHSR